MRNMFSYQTEIGRITIVESNNCIIGMYFVSEVDIEDVKVLETPLIKEAAKQLKEYFEGKRKEFELPLSPSGTEFQQSVWKALQTIPYGETWSYKQVAEKIGNPKASRAVGMANNKNPISIFIPCHRVIGSNGKLVGYGGGLAIKEYLLDLEKVN